MTPLKYRFCNLPYTFQGVTTLVPSVFVPLDQRSGNSDSRSSRQASMRSKGRRLEVRDWGVTIVAENARA